MKKTPNPLTLANTSIRPKTLKLVKLAAVFSGESITEFLSLAARDRAVRVLKSHKAQIPSDLVSQQ